MQLHEEFAVQSERSSVPGDPADGRAIDQLVFECLERLESEGLEAIEALCREHPDYAIVLRARIEALRACGWLARELGR